MTASLRFHLPCLATLTKAPPAGSQWVHQPKLDGNRLQAVKEGRTVRLFTKAATTGLTSWRPRDSALKGLPARSAVLECETWQTLPTSRITLLRKTMGRGRGAGLHLYAFDILHLNGKDLREPLFERE